MALESGASSACSGEKRSVHRLARKVACQGELPRPSLGRGQDLRIGQHPRAQVLRPV